MRLLASLLVVGLVLGATSPGIAAPAAKTKQAQANAPASDSNVQALAALLRTPEAKIDLAKSKLAIDRMIDPKVDVPGTLQQLDALAVKIRSRFPPGVSNRAKLDILLSSLYQPGPWNDNRPFSYDFDDPFGKNLRNKLLPTYLASRKGNCVSMPILFAILGQKLGLPVTLATAPGHVLVKFVDDDGRWLNVEATAGGFKYDSSYERETGISTKAIENEVYLRPLSQRESVGVMMSTLMEFYSRQDTGAYRVAVADLALEVNPKDVVAMVHKGSGIYVLLQQRYMRRYPKPSDIPEDMRQDYFSLSQENLKWFAKAEALGWSPPTEALDKSYLQNVKRESEIRQGAR